MLDNPENWIPNDSIARMLEAIPAGQVLLVSDSCYSGALASSHTPVEPAGNVNEVLDRRSVTVMTSGGEEPVSDEGFDGHSIFAWSLLESLRNVDDATPLSQEFDNIAERVTENYPQVPEYSGLAAANYEQGGDYLLERR